MNRLAECCGAWVTTSGSPIGNSSLFSNISHVVSSKHHSFVGFTVDWANTLAGLSSITTCSSSQWLLDQECAFPLRLVAFWKWFRCNPNSSANWGPGGLHSAFHEWSFGLALAGLLHHLQQCWWIPYPHEVFTSTSSTDSPNHCSQCIQQ